MGGGACEPGSGNTPGTVGALAVAMEAKGK
jgi:hypothetical protein